MLLHHGVEAVEIHAKIFGLHLNCHRALPAHGLHSGVLHLRAGLYSLCADILHLQAGLHCGGVSLWWRWQGVSLD